VEGGKPAERCWRSPCRTVGKRRRQTALYGLALGAGSATRTRALRPSLWEGTADISERCTTDALALGSKFDGLRDYRYEESTLSQKTAQEIILYVTIYDTRDFNGGEASRDSRTASLVKKS